MNNLILLLLGLFAVATFAKQQQSQPSSTSRIASGIGGGSASRGTTENQPSTFAETPRFDYRRTVSGAIVAAGIPVTVTQGSGGLSGIGGGSAEPSGGSVSRVDRIGRALL